MAEAKSQAGSQPQTLEVSEFEGLMNKAFKLKDEEQSERVSGAVKTLAAVALEQTKLISSDVVTTIEAMIAEIDKKLSQQINAIMHHADFQKLEGAWRGLNYLVNNTETDSMLKIRFMSVSKTELAKDLKKYKGVAWDQSPMF